MTAHEIISLWKRIETKIKENVLITEDEFINNIYGKVEYQVKEKKLIGVGGYININNYYRLELVSDFIFFLVFATLGIMIQRRDI